MGDARAHTKSAEYLNNNEKLAKLQKLTLLAKSQKSLTEYATPVKCAEPRNKNGNKKPPSEISVFFCAQSVIRVRPQLSVMGPLV